MYRHALYEVLATGLLLGCGSGLPPTSSSEPGSSQACAGGGIGGCRMSPSQRYRPTASALSAVPAKDPSAIAMGASTCTASGFRMPGATPKCA